MNIINQLFPKDISFIIHRMTTQLYYADVMTELTSLKSSSVRDVRYVKNDNRERIERWVSVDKTVIHFDGCCDKHKFFYDMLICPTYHLNYDEYDEKVMEVRSIAFLKDSQSPYVELAKGYITQEHKIVDLDSDDYESESDDDDNDESCL